MPAFQVSRSIFPERFWEPVIEGAKNANIKDSTHDDIVKVGNDEVRVT